VYPLRISSLNAGSTEVLLYVAADKRAVAEGFREEFSRQCDVPAASGSAAPIGRAPYPTFAKLLGGNQLVLTKLRATFSPQQMTSDVFLSWAKHSPKPNQTYVNGKPYRRPVRIGLPSLSETRWRVEDGLNLERRPLLALIIQFLVLSTVTSAMIVGVMRLVQRRRRPPGG